MAEETQESIIRTLAINWRKATRQEVIDGKDLIVKKAPNNEPLPIQSNEFMILDYIRFGEEGTEGEVIYWKDLQNL